MFLERVAELGFLQHNEESSVFLKFPVNTRKVLAIKVCDDLLRGEPSGKAFTSCAHVRVLMECIGQSFSLPIDVQTAVIIGKAVSVYKGWLFEKATQPSPLLEDEQIFFRDIFKHFSLLFDLRNSAAPENVTSTDDGDTVARHSGLCHDVLDTLKRVGRELGGRLTSLTWHTLLKIVLGFSDALLRIAEGQSYLADDLAPKLLEVLFELFLISGTRDTDMWQHLRMLLGSWRHRLSAIHQWGAVSSALVQHVLYLLYGAPYGCDHVHIVLPHLTSVDIHGLSPRFVFYAWYRVLHLLGDLESIPLPNNYHEAMRCVARIVAPMLSLPGLGGPAVEPAPSGDASSPSAGDDGSAGGGATAGGADDEAAVASTENAGTAASSSSSGAAALSAASGLDVDVVDRRLVAQRKRVNAALHVVGPWLFEAVHHYQQGYEQGKACALEALCGIMCLNAKSIFEPAYLACFYSGLREAFARDSNLLMSVILTKTTSLFQGEFDGSRILIPSYVDALERVLVSKAPLEGIAAPLVTLRRSCIKILGTLVCFPNHFEGVAFAEPSSVPGYAALGERLARLLVGGLETERDSANQQLLLWTNLVHLLENLDRSPSIALQFIQTLLANVLADDDAWSLDVISTALLILADLAEFGEYLDDKVKVSHLVVSRLSVYIERKMNRGSTSREPPETLVVEALFAMLRWVMVGQWIATDDSCLHQVLNVVDIGLGGKFSADLGAEQPYHQPSEKVREAAHLVFVMLVYHVGQFPTAGGDPSFTSSLATEASACGGQQGVGADLPVSCFVSGDCFMTLVHERRSPDAVRASALLRSPAGRFLWRANLNYFPHPVVEPPPLAAAVENAVELGHLSEPDSPFPVDALGSSAFVERLVGLLDGSEKLEALHADVLRAAEQCAHREETCRRRSSTATAVDSDAVAAATAAAAAAAESSSAAPPPLDTGNNSARLFPVLARPELREEVLEDAVGPRLFLSHLGFSSVANRTRFSPVAELGSDLGAMMKVFQNLDKQNARQCYAVGAIYLPQRHVPGVDDDRIFAYTAPERESSRVAADYHDFIESIGWSVELDSHKGFAGGLDALLTGARAPYFADCTTEVIFQVATIMNEANPAQSAVASKRKLLQTNKVVITWAETPNFTLPPAALRNTFVNIVVHPLPSLLYRVRILTNSKDPSVATAFGPLLNDMIVSKQVLATAVRLTAICYAKRFGGNIGKPMSLRSFLVDSLVKGLRDPQPIHKFYASQLFPLQTRQKK
jgi:RALGAPB N-terminal domain/Rap/ran-GAP